MFTLKSTVYAIIVVIISGSVVFGGGYTAQAAATGIPSTIELDGYMWSSTIGWISLNCKTGGTSGENICGTGAGQSDYRVIINTLGNLSGYAWSSNIGWIKFNPATQTYKYFPVGPGTASSSARVSGTYPDLTFEGWARACSGTLSGLDVNGDTTCSDTRSRTDGWDGWISLKGDNYQLRFNSNVPGTMYATSTAGGTAKDGFFWGSTNVGWVVADASMNWSTIAATLIGNGCIIPRGSATCTGLVHWNFSPLTIASPTIFQTSPTALSLKTGVASSTNLASKHLEPVLSYGVIYRIEARTGTTPLKAVTLSADCNVAAGDYWKAASSSCQFDTTQPPTVTLTSDKKIIRSGESASLHWSFESVLSPANCTLSGPGVPIGYMGNTTKVPTTNSSGDYSTGALSSYSTFTFKCVNGVLNSSASVSVEVVPTVIEN